MGGPEGVSDEEITFAVESLIKQEGGIVLVKEGKIIEEMPMPIAGLMSDRSGEWVDQKLTEIHEKAYTELGIWNLWGSRAGHDTLLYVTCSDPGAQTDRYGIV